MSVIESYQKFSKEKVRLNELIELRDESYKIIQYPNFYTLKVMEDVIEKKWEVLFDKLYISASFRTIKEYFEKLKEGHINREQFAEKANREFDSINLKISKIQDSVESNSKEFSTAYNDFFSKGASEEKDLGKRLIYHALMQPEAKEIIMEFLNL